MTPNAFWANHQYWQTVGAWEDWCNLAAKVTAAGRADVIEKHQPPASATWRTIDKRIIKVLAEMGWEASAI